MPALKQLHKPLAFSLGAVTPLKNQKEKKENANNDQIANFLFIP